MSFLIERARGFAAAAHAGQTRKESGDPYVKHPIRVAAKVRALGGSETMVVAALLHDVLEDTAVPAGTIGSEFGVEVLALVRELTNPSKGLKATRAEKKAIDRAHAANISKEAKIIKLCDRIDNLKDAIQKCDPAWGRMYAGESRLLAEVIGDADYMLKKELLMSCLGLEMVCREKV